MIHRVQLSMILFLCKMNVAIENFMYLPAFVTNSFFLLCGRLSVLVVSDYDHCPTVLGSHFSIQFLCHKRKGRLRARTASVYSEYSVTTQYQQLRDLLLIKMYL